MYWRDKIAPWIGRDGIEYAGPVDDVQKNDLVQNNLLAGGGYCVYGGTGTKGATANIRFINNRFSQKYHPNCGYFGVVASFNRNDPGNAWTGNYWDHNLQPVN